MEFVHSGHFRALLGDNRTGAKRADDTRNPIGHSGLWGFSFVKFRAHNRDRTGDLILTKDVLYRLSYVSDLHTT